MSNLKKQELNKRLFQIDHILRQKESVCIEWCQHTSLTYSNFQILDLLYSQEDHKGILPSEIADQLNIPRQTMTGILDSLEKIGYVVRKSHPTDRRKKIICLSSLGMEFAHKTLAPVYERKQKAFSTLSDKEQKMLLELLDRYVIELEKQFVGSRTSL